MNRTRRSSLFKVFSTSLFIVLFGLPASAQVVNFQGLTTAQNNAVNILMPLAKIPTTNAQFWDADRIQSVAIANGTAPAFNSLTPYSSADPNVLTSQKISIYDAPYTRPNLFQLADGFGSNLGQKYQALTTWTNPQPYGASQASWGGISTNVTNLIWFSGAMVRADNMAARQILGSGRFIPSGQTIATDYTSTLTAAGAATNIYGKAYSYEPVPGTTTAAVTTPNGIVYKINSNGNSAGALQVNGFAIPVYNNLDVDKDGQPRVDNNGQNYPASGNPRPFEVLSAKYSVYNQFIPTYYADNYPANTGAQNYNSNWGYLIGEPKRTGVGIDDQIESSSYASGHAAFGWYGGLLLGMLVPERYQQMITRGAENAVGRVVMGAHWATDIVGSRTLAYYELAQEMANTPGYVGTPAAYKDLPPGNNNNTGTAGAVVSVPDYQALFNAAYTDMRNALQAPNACGGSIQVCAQTDTSRFANKANNQTFYEASLTMGLPAVNPGQPAKFDFDSTPETRNAGYLLQTRFPYLTLKQRADVITSTQLAGGGFLDDGSAFGRYSRINLFAAANGYGSFDSAAAPVEITMDPTDPTLTASQKDNPFITRDTWSNNISGPGGLRLTAANKGLLELTGHNTYTGDTVIDGGELKNNGTISGNIILNKGGKFSGVGTEKGSLINNGGILAPGNSIGTDTILGDLHLGAGSQYEVDYAEDGRSDLILVGGKALLGGSVLLMNGVSQPAYLPQRRFTIISSAGGMSGQFSGISSQLNYSFLTPYLSYDAYNAYFGFNLTPFSTVARTINQRNVGNALTVGAYGPISGPGANILNTLFLGSYQSAQSVMNTVSGAGLAGIQTTAMEVGQMASSTVSDQIAFWRSGEDNDGMSVTLHEGDMQGHSQDRVRGVMSYAPVENGVTAKSPIRVNGSVAGFAAPATTPRTFRAWGSMFGGGSNFLADVGRGGPAANLGYYGGLLGVDYQIAPNALIGAALGGSTANFSAGSLTTSGNLTGFHAGLYGSYAMGASYVAVNETFSAYSNQTNRTAGGYSFLPYESLSANFGSTEFRTRLEGGHSVMMGGLKATPFVATEVAIYNNSGFAENSSLYAQSSLALRNNGQTMHSLPTFVGLRLANAYTLANGWRLAPIGSLAYVHEFFPQRQFTNILMSLPGQDFSVSGPRSTYNLVQTKIGAQLHLTNQFALFSDFQGEFSPVSQSYGGKVGMKYVW